MVYTIHMRKDEVSHIPSGSLQGKHKKRHILMGATNGTEVPQNNRMWDQLTEELNNSEIGPQKTKSQWKAVS